MKLATMDIGSGTVRVLMCHAEKGRYRREAVKRRITRLAEWFADGTIHPVAMDRTVAAARELAREARAFGAVEIRVACTGVARRAKNIDEYLARLTDEAGLDPVVIAGAFEAELSARGAGIESGLEDSPFILMDIGGFSTEVAQVRDRRLTGAVSMEIGAVMLTGKHFHNDPPTDQQLGACAQDVRAQLSALASLGDLSSFGPMVGTAGTITTLAAIDLKMERYEPERVNRHLLTEKRIDELLALFVSMTAADRLSLPGLEKGREDLMPAGTIICREIMAQAKIDRLLVTEGGLLEGIAVYPTWPPPEGRWLTPLHP